MLLNPLLSGFFLVDRVRDNIPRGISEFPSFLPFVDHKTPGHIKNCRNCERKDNHLLQKITKAKNMVNSQLKNSKKIMD